MNTRYQKNTLPKGQTRKSAAAAKPKKASSAGGSKPSSLSKAKGGTKAKQTSWIGDPKTPAFRAARKQWWISLGAGLVFTLIAISVANFFKTASWSRAVQTGTLALAYAGIFYALYVDWTKMRPMRKAWIASGGQEPKPAKADKHTDYDPETDDK